MRVTEWTDQWIEALRSGKHSQTKGVLYRKEDSSDPWEPASDGFVAGYCCLGVAACIMGELTNNGKVLSDPDDEDGFEPQDTELWPRQLAMLGISDAEQNVLAKANDGDDEPGERKTFTEIADAIERAKTTGVIEF